MVKRRFSAQDSTIKRELRNTMNKIEATSLKIEQDEFTGEVKVIFDRDGFGFDAATKYYPSLDLIVLVLPVVCCWPSSPRLTNWIIFAPPI